MFNTYASSSTALISFAANPNHTKTEGFKHFKKVYNCYNNCMVCDDPNAPYPLPHVIYNQVKNLGCSEREFKSLSLQDFIIAGLIATCRQMKWLSLTPYYHTQMQHFVRQWDARDNQGECHQTIFLLVFFVHFSTQLHFTFLTHLSPSCLSLLQSFPLCSLCLYAHKQTTRTQFDWHYQTLNNLSTGLPTFRNSPVAIPSHPDPVLEPLPPPLNAPTTQSSGLPGHGA